MEITENLLKKIKNKYDNEIYNVERLKERYRPFLNGDESDSEKYSIIAKAASELASAEEPLWEMIAGLFLAKSIELRVSSNMKKAGVNSFYDKIKCLIDNGLYGEYIIKNYTKDEICEAEKMLDIERDSLFTYAGILLLRDRYLIKGRKKELLETPQEMYMGIALHLAMNEKNERLKWVKRFYDTLSTLKLTMATPTLANARKPFHQLSSCFIDTVEDSLDGIYKSIDNFAKVSKYGGGMGLYFGKVRAQGSPIMGFEGAAGGVIRWIRLANDTAVAVDQLGVRQGAVAVYLDVWHKDLPEFLSLRTNNGDERMKAHDVFPAVCFPDYFWEEMDENIEGNWYLFCPHEVKRLKGYALEDCYGEEWKRKYLDCIADERLDRRVVPIKEIARMLIRSSVETGTPFIFNRDTVNRMNPNPHKGMIYASNLCTEIAQNMAPMKKIKEEIIEVDGETVVLDYTKPGEFVVCNLASLSLGNLSLEDDKEMEEVIETSVRALDNVIDLNFFPLPYAKINNHKYRPIGLGVSGYHHMLAKRSIKWESDEHLKFAEKVFSKIHYYTLKASMNLAKEKGAYEYFKGSDFDNGEYFKKRNLDGKFKELSDDIHKYGLRNGYLLATAPTSSTSIIAGTTAGLDPIMNRFFLEEKKNGLIPRLAPELSMDSWWYYKSAHLIDQRWSVKACGIRQRHIDQAQSMNLYITEEYTFRKLLDLWIYAYKNGVKTIYYTRSKSLEVESCDSCSA